MLILNDANTVNRVLAVKFMLILNENRVPICEEFIRFKYILC